LGIEPNEHRTPRFQRNRSYNSGIEMMII